MFCVLSSCVLDAFLLRNQNKTAPTKKERPTTAQPTPRPAFAPVERPALFGAEKEVAGRFEVPVAEEKVEADVDELSEFVGEMVEEEAAVEDASAEGRIRNAGLESSCAELSNTVIAAS